MSKNLEQTFAEGVPPEIEVRFKYKQKMSLVKKITTSKDCADILRTIFDDGIIEYKEEFMVLCLNRANKIMGWCKVSSGGVSGTAVDIKIIFSIAIKSLASSIIVAHNHPSGNKKPSEADITLTKKLRETGRIMDIPLLDHLIITESEFFSFADEGMI